MAGEHPQQSPPPKWTDAERDTFFRELRRVDERVKAIERQSGELVGLGDELRSLREAFDSLDKHVRDMMQADMLQMQAIGALDTRVTALAMHAGGQVGGLTGGAAGTESARDENKGHTARTTVITMALSCVTAIVVALISNGAQTVKPVPNGAIIDQETRDRLARVELEMKRRQPDAGSHP